MWGHSQTISDLESVYEEVFLDCVKTEAFKNKTIFCKVKIE